jgi:hypothetical protein
LQSSIGMGTEILVEVPVTQANHSDGSGDANGV